VSNVLDADGAKHFFMAVKTVPPGGKTNDGGA
jgi:hypothetical protein